MSLTLEDKDSHFKLAQLFDAFEDNLDVKLVKKILESRGDINYQISDESSYFKGSTALHISKRCNNADKLKVVQLLLKYGADFTIKDAKGETALHQVLENIEYGPEQFDTFWGLKNKISVDTVDAILSAHVEKSIFRNPENKYGFTHFHIACMADHALAVQFFLDNGVPIDLAINEDATLFAGCIPLFIAAKSCAGEVVKVLLRYGANPYVKDKDGMNLLHWLIKCNIEILDTLIIENVEVERKTWLSKLKMNQTMVDLLLKHNEIDSSLFVNENELSDLHIACTLENVSMVKQFLIQVAPINHQVDESSELWPGYTALHFAAHFDLETTKLLLTMGANLMIKNSLGLTPFDICLQRYAIKDIHFIMSTQPSWNDILLNDGRTKLLDLVSAMQNIAQFRSFLDMHITDINTSISQDSPLWPGYTLLHIAVLLSEQPKNRSDYSLIEVTRFGTDVVNFVPNLTIVDECLSRGADVTVADVLGSTPLHLAFRNQQTMTIEKLLQFHHSTANLVDKHKVSHLHIACASQDTNVMRTLLESDANIELQVASQFKFYRRKSYSNWLQVEHIPAGSTCLHIAVAGRSTEVVKLLVEKGADVNAIDNFGVTPIHCMLVQASHRSEEEISNILFSSVNLKEVVAGNTGITHLHVASYGFNDAAVKRLLDLGANIDARMGCQSALDDFSNRYDNGEGPPSNFECFAELTPLQVNLFRGPTSVTNDLINRGADLLKMAPYGENPLHFIIDYEQDKYYVDFLARFFNENETLTKRVEEEYGLTILHLASSIPNLEFVEKLIADGANVNAQMNEKALKCSGYTPLHMLMKIRPFPINILETARVLLAAGADVSVCNASGNTPLHYCLPKQEIEALLLNLMLNSIQDFDANPVGESSWSHFHIACYLNNLVVMEEFVNHGADVNAPLNCITGQEAGSSALHLVVRKPYENMTPLNVETIDFLLEHGADIYAQNAKGETVLHRVARFAPNRVDVVQRLVRAGADLNKLNNVFETPFTTLLLTAGATTEMIDFFIENGCLVNDFNAVHQRGHLSLPLCVSDTALENRANIFQALFKSPDIARADAAGRTAIHNIVSAAGFDISIDVSVEEYSCLIRKLCMQGCDIDSQDQLGRTALHIATQFKNNKAIAALLMNGADVNLYDNSGSTAFNYSFAYCECKESQFIHRHTNVMKTFYIHMNKLVYLRLDINEFNRTILMSNLAWDFNENEMENFYSEVDDINAFTFHRDSNSLNLKDLLSETGIVAVYPQKMLARNVIDKFYQSIDVYLGDYTDVIGLVELQVRKAVKRVTLIDQAAESLDHLFGIPFPDICRQVVLRFLSNADCENMIFATSSLK